MRYFTRSLFFILLLSVVERSGAQVPFDCTGQFYITFTPLSSSVSTLVETVIDPVTDQVEFITISNNLGTLINGAGYRSTDNFIYAVHPLDHNLYQIDALGTTRDLGVIDLNRTHLYFAADISPDGRYLVLVGTLGFVNGFDEEIRFVDLSAPGYPVTTRPLTGTPVNVLDIAFDPTDSKLYGVDARGNRLVVIDFSDGSVTAPFPATTLMDDAGSLFFDTFGDLYAYGGPPGNNGIQNTLYKVDKLTGEFRILTTGTRADATDGCSCPHTVELRKIVRPRVMVPCGEVEYVFTIANSSTSSQAGIDLHDTLPAGFTITEIVYNPYGGTVTSGDGSRILHLEDLTLLPGIDSIIIRVAIDDVPDGIYKNQAVLRDLPQALGGFALSDDPETIIKRDSTALLIQSFDDDIAFSLAICPGDEVELSALEYGRTFIWNDGSTDPTLTIFREGLYQVAAISSCDTLRVNFDVLATDINVSFDPEEYEIRLGDSIQLVPLVFNEGSTTSYHWTAPEGSGLISCKECPQITVTPFYDTEYTVVVENNAGCIHSATVLVKVDRTQRYFAPNIFSPNGDNINDDFYFRIRGVASIHRFVIFDRWGDVLHTGNTSMIRDPEVLWSLRNTRDANLPGVYVWLAEVEYIDGSHEFISGDVTLIK